MRAESLPWPVASAGLARYTDRVSYLLALIVSLVEDDATLAARIARGEQAALERLFARLGGRVRAVALRVLGRPAEADDVVQDCFVEVWQRAREFDPQRGSLATWVTTISHRRAIDRLRRRATRPLPADSAAVAAMPSDGTPQESAADAQLRARVAGALGTLGADQRAAIELMYFRGLSQREAAEELGVALGTLKSRVRAGMRALGELLDELARGAS